MSRSLPTESLQLEWPAPLMTAAEVAAVMRITPKTVRLHIRRGELRAIRLDGAGPYRVSAEDAQHWAEQQLVQADLGMHAVDRYVRRRMVEHPGATAASGQRRRRAGRVNVQ